MLERNLEGAEVYFDRTRFFFAFELMDNSEVINILENIAYDIVFKILEVIFVMLMTGNDDNKGIVLIKIFTNGMR